MKKLIDEVLNSKRKRGEINNLTADGYRYNLERFADWLADSDIAWEDVTEDLLWEYLTEYEWSQSTQHNALCAIRAFYRHQVGQANSPAEGLHVTRQEPGKQRTLTEEEVGVLLDFCTPNGDEFGLTLAKKSRDLAIFSLMLDTGLRSSEICRLTVESIDIEDGSLEVRVKGGRWSHRIFTEQTADRIQSWIHLRGFLAGPDVNALFVALGGSQPGTSLSSSSLRMLCYQVAEQAGLEQFSPHALRRTMACLAVKNGAPNRAVQVLGDWQSADMVTRYTKGIEIESLRKYLPGNGGPSHAA